VFYQNSSLHLGDLAPNFEADSTIGKISFHKWIDKSWCLFISHPKDFTPVCTTELGYAAKIKPEFDKRNVKLIAVSTGSVENHLAWIPDINEMEQTNFEYPLIDDERGEIAKLYGMVDSQFEELTTARNVFLIDPNKRIRLILIYPSSTGRNFAEILRVIDAIQLHDFYKVATPVNWKPGEDCLILAEFTDQQLEKLMPKSYKSLKSYLRSTPQPGPLPWEIKDPKK